jgi:hypothetical protein
MSSPSAEELVVLATNEANRMMLIIIDLLLSIAARRLTGT